MKVHYSGYAAATPTAVAGTACRPDGEHGRQLHATSVVDDVTCRSCLRAIRA